MNYIGLILVAIISIIISSCSTEVDVNGEWKDIPIVYCVLDHSSEYQYVKVNKTFLGPVPASQMAQVADSLFYESVNVVLNEYVNGNLARSFIFEPVDTIQKPDGYFSTEKNTIWMKSLDLNQNATYEIVVDINNGAHTITGEASLIDGIYISRPSALMPAVELYSYSSDSEYIYYNGANGRVFQMSITFNYIEVIDGDTVDKVHSIYWPQTKEYRSNPLPSDVKGKFSVLAFYNLLTANIPPAAPNVKRLVKMPNSIVFNLAAADENYATYMEVTSPSQGIVQEKPSFTNLDGGYGLFAARYNVQIIKPLGSRTLDSISRGIYTKDLGFADRYDYYYVRYVN